VKRIVALIDGFNVYHAIKNRRGWDRYKWLNYRKLASLFCRAKDTLEGVYYFTALATWLPDSVSRHRTFIRALETEDVQVIYGKFKKKDRRCAVCRRVYSAHEEEETDVNIATHLFRLAVEDAFDIALVISADSDLVPAIKEARRTFPNKEIGIVVPPGQRAVELKQTADFHHKIRERHLISSAFPEEIDLPSGSKLVRPKTWK
jgi:uncharacterized LabA/DUF88 family protein